MLLNFVPLNSVPLNSFSSNLEIQGTLELVTADLLSDIECYHFTVRGDLLLTALDLESFTLIGIVPISITCTLDSTTFDFSSFLQAYHLVGELNSSDFILESGNFTTLHTSGEITTSTSDCSAYILADHTIIEGSVEGLLSTIINDFQGIVSNTVLSSELGTVFGEFSGIIQNGIFSAVLTDVICNFSTFQQFGNVECSCDSIECYFLVNNSGTFSCNLQSDLETLTSNFVGFTEVRCVLDLTTDTSLQFSGKAPEAIECYLDLQTSSVISSYLGSATAGRILTSFADASLFVNAFNYRATNCYLELTTRTIIYEFVGQVPQSYYVTFQTVLDQTIFDGFGFDTAGVLTFTSIQDTSFTGYGLPTIGGSLSLEIEEAVNIEIIANVSVIGTLDLVPDLIVHFISLVPLEILGELESSTSSFFSSYGTCSNWAIVETNTSSSSLSSHGIGQIHVTLDINTSAYDLDTGSTFPVTNFSGTFTPVSFFGFIDSTSKNITVVSNGQLYSIGALEKSLEPVIPSFFINQIQGYFQGIISLPYFFDIGIAPCQSTSFTELDLIIGNLVGVVPFETVITETVLPLDSISLNILATGGVYKGRWITELEPLLSNISTVDNTGEFHCKTSRIYLSLEAVHTDAVSGTVSGTDLDVNTNINVLTTVGGSIEGAVNVKTIAFYATTPLDLQAVLYLRTLTIESQFVGVNKKKVFGNLSAELANCITYSYGKNAATGTLNLTLKDLTNTVFLGSTPIHAQGTLDKVLDKVSFHFSANIPLIGQFYFDNIFTSIASLGSHTLGVFQESEFTTVLGFEAFTVSRVNVIFDASLENIKPQPYSFFFGRIQTIGYFSYETSETFLPDAIFDSYGVCPVAIPEYQGSFEWYLESLTSIFVLEHHAYLIDWNSLLELSTSNFEAQSAIHGTIAIKETRTYIEAIVDNPGKLGRIEANLQTITLELVSVVQVSAFFIVQLESLQFYNTGVSITLVDFTPSEPLQTIDLCFKTETPIAIEGLFDNQLSEFESINDTVFFGRVIEEVSGYVFTTLKDCYGNFIVEPYFLGLLNLTTKVFSEISLTHTLGEISCTLDTFTIFRFTGDVPFILPDIIASSTQPCTMDFRGISLVRGVINSQLANLFATYIYGTTLIFGRWIGGDRMPCCYVAGCPSDASLPSNPTYEDCAKIVGPDFSCPVACPPVEIFDLDVTSEDGRHPIKKLFWTLQYIGFDFKGYVEVDIKGTFHPVLKFESEGGAEFLEEQTDFFPYLPTWEGFAGSGYVTLFGMIQAEFPPQSFHWRNTSIYDYFIGTIDIVPGKLIILDNQDSFIGQVIPAYQAEVHSLLDQLIGDLYLRTSVFGRFFSETPSINAYFKTETIIHAIGDVAGEAKLGEVEIIGQIVIYTYAVLYPWDYSFTLQTNMEITGKTSVFGRIVPEEELEDSIGSFVGTIELSPVGYVRIKFLNSNCKGAFDGEHIPKYSSHFYPTLDNSFGDILGIVTLYARVFLDFESINLSLNLLTPIKITATLDSSVNISESFFEGSTPLVGYIQATLQDFLYESDGTYYEMQYVVMEGVLDPFSVLFFGYAPVLGEIQIDTGTVIILFAYYRIIDAALEIDTSTVIMDFLVSQDPLADEFPVNFKDWIRGFLDEEAKPIKVYETVSGQLVYSSVATDFYETLEDGLHYFEWKVPDMLIGEYTVIAADTKVASQVRISDLLTLDFDEVILHGN